MASLNMLLFVIFIFFISLCKAQDRAPHGLAYETPMALSPEAYNFFHPDTQGQSTKGACSEPDCSTLSIAAIVQSTPAHESTSPPEGGRKRLGAGSIASIPISLLLALLVGVGVYYAVITRRNNAARAKAAQLQSDV